MASFVERALGAARLDAATYEEVEADAGALGQAMGVVVLASLATGIGSSVASGAHGTSLVAGALINVLAWFVWAFVVYLVGTRILPTAQTEADVGQLLRTTGFSAAPGMLGVLGVVPVVGRLVLLVAWLWQIAAMVVAVRQALDYESTGRAIAVCLIGFLAHVLVSFLVLGLVMSVLVAVSGAPPPAAAIP